MKSIAFVQKMFHDYYVEDFSLKKVFPMIERREFGFASFDGYMLRHKSFKSEDDLTLFLQNSVPRDAYYSSAYYEDPEAEMEKKGWIGADLVFDIDADHIPTSCDKLHDEWTCVRCGFAGKGPAPEKCPLCSGEKFNTSTWPCEVCLTSARTETAKLLDMLTQDFGLAKDEIRVFFSGHRGYHVHVENETIKTLDSIARKEIVDYVCGLGFNVGFYEKSGKKGSLSILESSGVSDWHRRVFEGVYDFILNAEREDLTNAGFKSRVVESVLKNKNAILKRWKESVTLTAVKGLGSETLSKIIELTVRNKSAKIDTVVTTDTHRLIRMPETLHSKTGFKKVEIPIGTINDFDPFLEALAFKKDAVLVLISNVPKFRIGEETFGPYKNQKVELLTAATILLLCRDKAEVVD